jgi:hypothetical protein
MTLLLAAKTTWPDVGLAIVVAAFFVVMCR